MLEITFPYHGAVLNHRYGTQNAAGLTIDVTGLAPSDAAVTVNGVAARRKGNQFIATITITERETDITAVMDGAAGQATSTIRVLWDKDSRKRYRIAIDDNVFFLRDLCQKRPANLFDNLYLSILKGVHDTYGSKFSLNCFFESPEKDFNLTMMPDSWKAQFRDNADWLKLTWHAYNEFPDRPYQYATANQIIHDLDAVQEQIVRFAGEDSWCMPTIIHWGEVPSTVLPALYDRGIRVLSGYFFKGGDNRYLVNFGLDDTRCAMLDHRRLLVHWPSKIIFSRLTEVINITPTDQVIPKIQADIADFECAEIIDFLTHEQYFWPFYHHYIPDHAKRINDAARFATENGYEPVLYHEGFLGI